MRYDVVERHGFFLVVDDDDRDVAMFSFKANADRMAANLNDGREDIASGNVWPEVDE